MSESTHTLSLPLPHTLLSTTLHINLTITPLHLLIFLTTTNTSVTSSLLDPSTTLSIPGINTGITTTTTTTAEIDPLHPPRRNDTAVPRGAVGVGSLVYAMPMKDKKDTLCTPLLQEMATLETAERIARILARRVGRPVYLGNSMALGGMGGGGSVEEEMEVVKIVVEGVVGRVRAAEEEG